MTKKINKFNDVIICLFLMFSLSVNAQISTIYSGNHYVDGNDQKAFVDEVDIYDNYTLLKLSIIPKVFKNRIEIWYSPKTYLEAGNSRLNFLGALSSDKKTYHSIKYDEHYGWNNVAAGAKLTYTLVFEGCPPENVDFVSLKDEGENYHGYEFYKLPINNRHSMETAMEKDSSETELDSVAKEDNVDYVSGITISPINLREDASKDSRLIIKVGKGTKVIYDIESLTNGYVWTYLPSISKWGYALKDALSGASPVHRDESFSFLQNTGKTKDINPVVTIFNKSATSPMVRVNRCVYFFKPYEKKTIHLKPGTSTFFVTSPGIKSLLTNERLMSNTKYDYTIFVKTYTVRIRR